jgi:hypothetical protein
MQTATSTTHDVMQVCRNGHVITDRLRGAPETGRTHCKRCGASTLERCETCGNELPGAAIAIDLVPIGSGPAPAYCLICGAHLPWSKRQRNVRPALEVLESLLRRMPCVVAELRWRQTDKPVLRIEDERDLEDLIRAILPLHFDAIRPETRTPAYSHCTRTDLLLPQERIALTMKIARRGLSEIELGDQVEQDVAHYCQRANCRTVVAYIHDPEALLHDRALFERTLPASVEQLELRCIIGTRVPLTSSSPSAAPS